MTYSKHGAKPGIDTSIEKAPGVSQDSKGLRTLARLATNFIAFIKRIATPDAFLISTLCLIIAQAVYAIVRAI